MTVFVAYQLREQIKFPGTLTIEYTFIRYIPERRGNPQPNDSTPRSSCPYGLLRKARWGAIPNLV